MTRPFAFAALAVVMLIPVSFAEEPKVTKTVDLSSSVDDLTRLREAPDNGVIVSQKAWDKLAAAWGIKEVPKVDFTKEMLIVGAHRGSEFKFLMEVKTGDLKVELVGDKDLKPGFRYKIVSIKRDGIKTVNGKELPKE
ncbi:MAG: hypothetical protein L0241_28420 [Planctomycetia bacterium]|nr:hypothetical protein [Planctomycetia bacterium]